MEKLNDYELLYLIRQKDEEALDLLIRKYRNRIYRIMSKLTGKSNYFYSTNDEQNDLFQRCLIALFDTITMYREGSSEFSYFVCMRIDSEVRNYLRNQRTKANHMFKMATSLDLILNESEGSYLVDMLPSKNYEYDPLYQRKIVEAKETIDEVETELTQEEIAIWKLRRQGYNYVEISKLMNLSTKRIAYVNQKIKKILTGIID